MYRKNLLRQKLQAGEKLIGTWHEIPDPVVTEILSLSGLDFVLVDNEHGPGDVLLLRQLKLRSFRIANFGVVE